MKVISLRKALLIFATLLLSSQSVFSQNRKSVAILGDSYSTFENFVEPDTNVLWYFLNPNPDNTDVSDVSQTWWHQFIKENGLHLEKNNSFSGSTICNTGYHGEDFTDRSFITRMKNLGSPDIILIFGATNDSWADSPIGDFIWDGWTKEKLYEFRPALTYMLSFIKDRYPNTDIFYIINDGLKPEITTSITEACEHYGIPYIKLREISKTAGHPNIKGMRQIADQITPHILKKQQ